MNYSIVIPDMKLFDKYQCAVYHNTSPKDELLLVFEKNGPSGCYTTSSKNCIVDVNIESIPSGKEGKSIFVKPSHNHFEYDSSNNQIVVNGYLYGLQDFLNEELENLVIFE